MEFSDKTFFEYPNFSYNKNRQSIEKCDNIMRETKYAVLEGNLESPNIVALIVYGTKPVHFLSMADENLVCDIKG